MSSGRGWHKQSYRHALAARGISTGRNFKRYDYYTLKKEWVQGNYAPSVFIKLENNLTDLGIGSGDHVTVYRDDKYYYVLGENVGLGYASMTVIDRKTNEKVWDQYFQDINDENSIGRDLKKDFFDYSDANKIKIMLQYSEV